MKRTTHSKSRLELSAFQPDWTGITSVHLVCVWCIRRSPGTGVAMVMRCHMCARNQSQVLWRSECSLTWSNHSFPSTLFLREVLSLYLEITELIGWTSPEATGMFLLPPLPHRNYRCQVPHLIWICTCKRMSSARRFLYLKCLCKASLFTHLLRSGHQGLIDG